MSRSVIAARTLTSPRQNIKSSTNDLLPSRSFHIWISYRPPYPEFRSTVLVISLWHYTRPTSHGRAHSSVQVLAGIRKLALPRDRHRVYRCKSGRDSDLEAFSLNPSDGSFAPLAFRPDTYTKCLNLHILSY
ncbi:unnamed protein product [Dicrocoelium dendriticum]|nr:unnamed protein product [Dicrocoelium dendriticum]